MHRLILAIAVWVVLLSVLTSCGSTPCPQICTPDQKRCGDKGVWWCAQEEKTGCYSWALLPCASNQTCKQQDNSAQCLDSSNPTCTQVEHHKDCQGQAVHWFDECNKPREKIQDCQSPLVCQKGACIDPNQGCTNACNIGNKRCAGNAPESCILNNETGCSEWKTSPACPQGQTCQSGTCQQGCPPPCKEGATECQGKQLKTCQKQAGTGCFLWSQPLPCPTGQQCKAGVCEASCNDACKQGQKQCKGNATQTCEKNVTSGCLEWSSPKTCPQGQTCQSGACKSSCPAPCKKDQKRCTGNKVETCTQNAQGCLVWKQTSTCSAGQTCQQGQCKSTCPAPCQEHTKKCAGTTIQICKKDTKGCLVWTKDQDCPTDKICDKGACKSQTDPSLRTQQQVCQRWKADYPIKAQANFKSNGNCDAGSISQGSIDDAIRRITLYRWLMGLAPVTEKKSYSQSAQSCAVLQANNNGPGGGVNAHHPPKTWKCYTSTGGATSGRSNLSWGVSHPADTVPQYISDRNTPSLGHRLWIMSPKLGQTGFGLATGTGRWRVASCMYAFDYSNKAKGPDVYAFPPAGIVPLEAMGQRRYPVNDWHITSSKYKLSGVTSVKMTRLSDNDVQTLTPRKIGNYGNPSGLSWKPRFPKAGETYKVELGTVYTYQVKFVSCP